MRLAAPSIIVVIMARAAMAAASPQPASTDIENLRSELAGARLAKEQAAANKTRAYRDAHILYKNCAKELRVFCLLSAQKIMRDADLSYKDREGREFPDIAALERAVSAFEAKVKPADAVR